VGLGLRKEFTHLRIVTPGRRAAQATIRPRRSPGGPAPSRTGRAAGGGPPRVEHEQIAALPLLDRARAVGDAARRGGVERRRDDRLRTVIRRAAPELHRQRERFARRRPRLRSVARATGTPSSIIRRRRCSRLRRKTRAAGAAPRPCRPRPSRPARDRRRARGDRRWSPPAPRPAAPCRRRQLVGVQLDRQAGLLPRKRISCASARLKACSSTKTSAKAREARAATSGIISLATMST